MSDTIPFLDLSKLVEIFSQTKTATAVHVGAEAYIQFANDAMIRIWGKDRSVIGKSLAKALPELKGQPFLEMFKEVWNKGLTIGGSDTPAELLINGEIQTIYFDFEYKAILGAHGETICILHTATDVTERFLKNSALERALETEGFLAREQALNEELAASNEEMLATNEDLQSARESLQLINETLEQMVAERTETIYSLNLELEASNEEIKASNEELAASNEELSAFNEEILEYNQKLSVLYNDLKLSRDETEFAINAAGMGTFDLDPVTGRFSGNALLKSWFGLAKHEEIPLDTATSVISAEDQERVISAIQRSLEYSSGGDYEADYSIINPNDEVPRIVKAKGKTIFNELKQPIRLSGVLQDVTEQVNSRQEIIEVNTRLQIAMDAGSLGSTEVDLATGAMICNEQFRRCFGRNAHEHFVYADIFEAMLPHYRDNIREMVRLAKENHSIYRAEYEITWPDGSLHWISAHGRARYDNDGNAIKMVGIISEITEYKADEQRKNDFIGMVSHELKTPLTSLTGYVQLLHSRSKKSGDDFAAVALEKSNIQLRKMANMINSFLNVSRLESGKIHIELEHFNLSQLISEIESEFAVIANSHHLTLETSSDLFVEADRDKIGHVLNNIISNAVKYSPSGSTISISSKTVDNKVVVGVSDQGSGIAHEDKLKLFERYYRVLNQARTISGFGIGLYLCAEIIKRHHGEIWVESEPGKGSTFYFSLPLSD